MIPGPTPANDERPAKAGRLFLYRRRTAETAHAARNSASTQMGAHKMTSRISGTPIADTNSLDFMLSSEITNECQVLQDPAGADIICPF